jgi:TatD DNase family protein
MYVDVHTHLTDERFASDTDAVVARARLAGVSVIVNNGVCPDTNRATLDLARRHSEVKAALGIYPVYAVARTLPSDFVLEVPRFDPDPEIRWIREQADLGHVHAIGEIGLDGHWVGDETFAEQERVFEALLQIAMELDMPAIIHTRKREARALEILQHLGVRRAVFHCFGGNFELARRCAAAGYALSIPANAERNKAFAQMLKSLPPESLLTETDAPYLSPDKGTRNEPANVTRTIAFLAKQRALPLEEARDLVWQNYRRVFNLV